MEAIRPAILTMAQSSLFQLVAILVIMDVIFGCLRAIKEKAFNSTIGINGMIRKAGILVSLLFMALIDTVIHIDLIAFVPEAITQYLPAPQVGLLEFFAIIYTIYEILSVLKNMTLAGLPVRKIWDIMREFLQKNTGEIAEFVDSEDENKENEQEDEVE